jgi:hypothetical protein
MGQEPTRKIDVQGTLYSGTFLCLTRRVALLSSLCNSAMSTVLAGTKNGPARAGPFGRADYVRSLIAGYWFGFLLGSRGDVDWGAGVGFGEVGRSGLLDVG